MELGFIWTVLVVIFGGVVALRWLLGSVNWWFYETKLGDKRFSLPPGDLGWPFIGNMWSFLRAFKSSNPDSFIANFVTRFGNTGIYKAFMFGNPSIIVTVPEACRRVLTDDEYFKPGWPSSTLKLIGRKSFIGISYEEHKRLRRLTAAPVNGHEALSMYMRYIEEIVTSALDKWAGMGQIEFLTELRKLTFRIIMYIFLSSESEQVMEALEREYTTLNYGVRAMAINLPGFAYHKALKARKNLVAIFQSIVNERREKREKQPPRSKKDMMDALLEVEDENGRRLNDEEIIDVLVMYLNAGHESSGHITMWATLFLQQHPEFFQRAKAEQEAIVKNRPPTQKGLTLKEVRQMEYLSKVVDESLRLLTFSFVVFREAKADVQMSGYTIPKGWKVLVWFRSIHLDPEIYPNPKEFNPSRWDGLTPKAGTFLPFGAGSRMCPGNDLAKLEITIFLHYFLLNYELERVNPRCPPMAGTASFVRKVGTAVRKVAGNKGSTWNTPHMAAASRAIVERIPLVDLVVEVRDARIPLSSEYEHLRNFPSSFRRIIVLNKMDLANRSQMKEWMMYFEQQNCISYGVNSHNKDNIKEFLNFLQARVRELKKAGHSNYTTTIMLVGIPNVGKSALANSLHQIGRISAAEKGKLKHASVSAQPGETKDISSFKIASHPNIYVLDTPGILPPEILDIEVCSKLALTGAISDCFIGETELARYFLAVLNLTVGLKAECSGALNSAGCELDKRQKRKYPTDHTQDFIVQDVRRTLFEVASSFGGNLEDENDLAWLIEAQLSTLQKALHVTMASVDDTHNKVATKLLNLYRTGRLGHYTLDRVPWNA
ncbi:hypothetical protein F0562_014623 [Nyssa sinensis]|uniref:CP-type G domain-containing protein n=1 Tax=Nyssa sinensis TaxID=561372 RepID=A0A5J4ZT80_9ASTE|nr:hypothetical protein F0562_014623 [Nyssa sinensis]